MADASNAPTKREVVQMFQNLVHLMSQKANGGDREGFDYDFDMLTKIDDQLRCDAQAFRAACDPRNRCKNRYQDIMANESTMCKVSGVPESENYFNGNYVCPPGAYHTYVCSQAPLPSTCGDFWNVMMYYGVSVVVMLCQVVENGRTKSEQYWPAKIGGRCMYSTFEVVLTHEELRNTYLVRTLLVTNTLNGDVRNFTHFQFLAWPDFGVPENPEHIIDMLRSLDEVSSQERMPTGELRPICVHCSAGVGRTGTLIAMQSALDHFKDGNTFSLFDIVKNLKQQRTGMVQRREQYKFCFEGVLKELQRLVSQQFVLGPTENVGINLGPLPGEEPLTGPCLPAIHSQPEPTFHQEQGPGPTGPPSQNPPPSQPSHLQLVRLHHQPTPVAPYSPATHGNTQVPQQKTAQHYPHQQQHQHPQHQHPPRQVPRGMPSQANHPQYMHQDPNGSGSQQGGRPQRGPPRGAPQHPIHNAPTSPPPASRPGERAPRGGPHPQRGPPGVVQPPARAHRVPTPVEQQYGQVSVA